MTTPTPNPWASESTPLNKLEMGKPYVLAIFPTRNENPIKFFALERPLTVDEYGVLAEAGQRENKDILEVVPRRREVNRLYLTIKHTGPNDPSDIVVVFDIRGNGRFELDTGA